LARRARISRDADLTDLHGTRIFANIFLSSTFDGSAPAGRSARREILGFYYNARAISTNDPLGEIEKVGTNGEAHGKEGEHVPGKNQEGRDVSGKGEAEDEESGGAKSDRGSRQGRAHYEHQGERERCARKPKPDTQPDYPVRREPSSRL
jgi:hypothetical protein